MDAAYLSELNAEQRSAVTATDGPVLVLAGAGSGKTRVITARIAHLVAQKRAQPDAILGLTFTNKAAREMGERVGRLIKGSRGRPNLCTFHSFGVQLLRVHIDKLGYRPRFVIFDDQDQQSVVKQLMEEGGYDTGHTSPKNAHFALQQAKGRGETPQTLRERRDSEADVILGHLMAEYQETLRRMNAVDFEDILQLSLRLCREHPAACQEYFARYRYVMVDEYQDTNRTQYELLKHIVAPHGNLCVVGDDDQSIYRWRGAEPGNILDFETDFPGTQVVRLEQNYRSTGTILAAANQVIRNNAARKAKTLRTAKGPGERLTWLLGNDEREELEKVVTHLRLTRMREDRRWSEFAILYRSNHQSRVVEEALREEGIPYQLVGGTRFYERREVKDALAYLRLCEHPHDEVSLLRVLNFPKRGIGKTSQARLMEYAAHQGRPPFEVLRSASECAEFGGAVASSMERFAELITRYRERYAANQPLGATTRELLNEVGLHRALEKDKSDARSAERAVTLVHELELAVDQYARRREGAGQSATLKDYLEHVALLSLPEDEDGKERPPQVSLLTVHSAKGLEFPQVYLVNAAEEVFPNRRALADDGEEEERRLFYVAVTRAQRRLIFSMAKLRKRYGETIPQQPSRFLLEIDPELFDGPAPATDFAQSAVARQQKTKEAKSRFFDQMRRMKEGAAAGGD